MTIDNEDLDALNTIHTEDWTKDEFRALRILAQGLFVAFCAGVLAITFLLVGGIWWIVS